jgi:Holliday junction resolvase
MGGRAVEGSGLLNRQTPNRGFMGSNPIPSANFKARVNVGENAERMLWAWLYGQYGDALRHVSEYSPDKFRDSDGDPLPDFRVTQKGKKTLFIESKMKVGWKGCLNINVDQVKSYLNVAKKNNADFILYFVCTDDMKMYKLTPGELRNKAKTNWDRNNVPFFTYEKSDLEIVFNKMPRAIFNTDELYRK